MLPGASCLVILTKSTSLLQKGVPAEVTARFAVSRRSAGAVGRQVRRAATPRCPLDTFCEPLFIDSRWALREAALPFGVRLCHEMDVPVWTPTWPSLKC